MPRRDQDLAIQPGGRLERLLTDPRMTRSLRRDILAVVQAPETPRRARLARSIERRMQALGFRPE